MFQMYLREASMPKLFQKVKRNDIKKMLIMLIFFVVGQIISTILFDLNSFVIARGDSYFYFKGASQIFELSSFEFMYAGYMLLLHFSQLISSSGVFMVLIQSAFTILAAYALFSLAKEYGGLKAAWLSVGFYLLNPMLSQWTRYILTESIFYSLIIIGFRLVTLQTNARFKVIVPVTLLLTTLRPNGIIVACSLFSILILKSKCRILIRSIFLFLTWIPGILLAVFFLNSGSTNQATLGSSIFRATLEGNVVFGVTELNLEMPEPKTLDRSNFAFVQYVIQNPVAIFQIALLRIYWELKQIRPWYSSSLNFFLIVTMITFYIFIFFGWFQVLRKPITKAIIVMTLPSSIFIGLTWAIWEGRFGWWFLVTWIPLFGIGLSKMS